MGDARAEVRAFLGAGQRGTDAHACLADSVGAGAFLRVARESEAEAALGLAQTASSEEERDTALRSMPLALAVSRQRQGSPR